MPRIQFYQVSRKINKTDYGKKKGENTEEREKEKDFYSCRLLYVRFGNPALAFLLRFNNTGGLP